MPTDPQPAGAELEPGDDGATEAPDLVAFEDPSSGHWLCLRNDERALLDLVREDPIAAPTYDASPEEIRAAVATTIVRLGRHRYNSPAQILRRFAQGVGKREHDAGEDTELQPIDIRGELERELETAVLALAEAGTEEEHEYARRAESVESIAKTLQALPTVDVADAEEKRRAIRQAAQTLDRVGRALAGATELSFRRIHHAGPPGGDVPDDVGGMESGRMLPAGYEDLDPAAIAELSGKLYAIAGGPRPA